MSDWYRSGRDHDRGRHDGEPRDRRESGGQDRRAQELRRTEQRSFDERRGAEFDDRRPDPERGGYSGRSFGGPDFDPAREDYRDRGGERQAGRSRNPPRGAPPYGAPDHQRQPAPYGQEAGRGYDQGDIGHNPALLRLAGGEADHPWRDDLGAGRHRGRGPKNYTRSDERIREDVNDRLSDDPWLDASEIEVQVKSCEITLGGTVHSRDDKRRAEDLVERISGVQHVQNNLRVAPRPGEPPGNAPGGGSFAT